MFALEHKALDELGILHQQDPKQRPAKQRTPPPTLADAGGDASGGGDLA